MQRALGIVDFVTFAQGVEAVPLAGVQVPGHLERVGHAIAQGLDGHAVEAGEFGVEEAEVERRVVNDQFGAVDEIEKLVDDVGEGDDTRGVGTFVEPFDAASTTSRGRRATALRTLAERFLAEAAGQGFTPPELLAQIARLASNFQDK